MARVAFIGAGSTVFTRSLVGDVLRRPELADTATFALMDVDAERLATSEAAVRAIRRSASPTSTWPCCWACSGPDCRSPPTPCRTPA